MRISLLVLCATICVAALAPIIAPADPMKTDPAGQLQPPGRDHLLGTDLLGRDVLSRTLHGGRRTLLVAALATLIAVTPGALLGLAAGTLGGKFDAVIVALVNALLAFPGLMIALVALTVLGTGILPLAIATGAAQVASYARVARSSAIAARSMGYVEAAEAMGARQRRIITGHILPNVQQTLLAYAGVVFGYCILNSAALTALGLGGEPGVPDWGVILAEGRTAFRVAPWISVAPGIAIAVTVWSVNRLADRLRVDS